MGRESTRSQSTEQECKMWARARAQSPLCLPRNITGPWLRETNLHFPVCIHGDDKTDSQVDVKIKFYNIHRAFSEVPGILLYIV